MEILFISFYYWPPHFGGELKLEIEGFESLIQRGHHVTVLTSGVPGFSRDENISGVHVLRSQIYHNSRIGKAIRRVWFPVWVYRQLARHHFDILHLANMGGVNSLAQYLGTSLVLNAAHRKNIATVSMFSLADNEKEFFSTKGLDKKLRNKNFEKLDAIVSVSPALEASVSKHFSNKSNLIVPGVHDNIFKPINPHERELFRSENKISDQDVVFTFLGSVGLRKGFDLLVRSFIDLEKEFPGFRLWVIGPSTKFESQNITNDEVEELLTPLESCQNKVHFWGRIDDQNLLSKILACSDAFVFPSRKEGFGIAPIMAMAVGLPVIISRIPGVTDLANIDGMTGYYFTPGDISGLKTAIKKIIEDPTRRVQMGTNARKVVLESFRWEQYIQSWEKLLLNLCDKKKNNAI